MVSSVYLTLGRFLSGLFILACMHNLQAGELSLFIGQEHWLYKELDQSNHELNRETGPLTHIETSLLLEHSPKLKFFGLIQQQNGALNYNGKTQAGAAHTTQTDTKSYKLKLDGRYYWHSYYFAGGGLYQYWDRKIKAANNVSHLYEKYHWYGPSISLGNKQSPTPKLELDFEISAFWLFGYLNIDLTEVPYANGSQNYGKPKLNLNNGYQTCISLLFKYQLTSRLQLLLKHQQGYRSFPASSEATVSKGRSTLVLHEPKSSNYYFNYALGVNLLF